MMTVEQAMYSLLPGDPRFLQCNAPLGGVGTLITRPLGIRPSMFTPHLCNGCEQSILKVEGGAEVELSLLFADIRGSTSKAQGTSPTEYTQFIQRFYKSTSQVLINRNALVNRLVGEQVIGLFVPRSAGVGHANGAIASAMATLKAAGHEHAAGPW